ncbi:SRR1-like protein [Dermacentor andersoni]|uniref:SRR1-like protein n=1 Tax=Dermacentor andersoni TaxID=34620 RepID=UPI0021554113|nr:SRR1-like protein [Dermacentor andersoni]
MNADVMSQDGFTVVKRRGKSSRKLAEPLLAIHTDEDDEGPDEIAVLRRISEAEADLQSSAYFENFLNVLTKCLCVLPGDTKVSRIVCYGLGNFSACVSARFQLALLICIRRQLSPVSVEIYDPVFTEKERKILESLRFAVLVLNDEGKRSVQDRTLFYMPHCGTPLYNSVLWANWDADSLGKVVIFGNSFDTMWTNKLDATLRKKCGFLVNVRPAVREFAIANDFKYSDVFNDLALHTFDASLLHADVWSSREEPLYDGDDEIVLALHEKCKI